MTNHVLILTHNNLPLTMRAARSIAAQDIRTTLNIVDNGSTDGTKDCIFTGGARLLHAFSDNAGVSKGWNRGLSILFEQTDQVFLLNNDVLLPRWFCSQLLAYDKPFVSGVSVDKMEQIAEPAPMGDLQAHPDFSAFLLRREVWDKVGAFDESMKHYASDNDWHVRAHKAGIPLWKANVPFYHERSSTINLASEQERQEIQAQANQDRFVFKSKWGVMPWGEGYDALFG